MPRSFRHAIPPEAGGLGVSLKSPIGRAGGKEDARDTCSTLILSADNY